MIGREIENPFGNDVNDLPLDVFCQQLATDIDLISSMRKPKSQEYVKHKENMILFPISASGYESWAGRSETRIRKELKLKTEIAHAARMDLQLQTDVAEKPMGDEKV